MKSIKLFAVALVLGATSLSAQVQQGKADTSKKAAKPAVKAETKSAMAKPPEAKPAAGKTEAKAAPAPKGEAKADAKGMHKPEAKKDTTKKKP